MTTRKNAETRLTTRKNGDALNRLTRLSDLSMALSTGTDLETLLRKLAASVRESFHADEAFFLLLDVDSFELVKSVYSGKARKRPTSIPCPERRLGLTSPGEYGFAPCVHQSENAGESDLSSEARLYRSVFVSRRRLLFQRRDLDAAYGDVPFQSALVMPLLTASQALGLLVVSHWEQVDGFSNTDLEEATVYANLAALAVEHMKLIREREARIREMEKLNTLAKRFSTVQTLEGLIGLSFEYLSQIISHELGVVVLFSGVEETRYFVANRVLTPTNLENLTAHIKEIADNLRGRSAKLVRSQQIFLPTKEGSPMGRMFRGRLQSFLTVPLTVQGKNIGLVNLSSILHNSFNREHLRAFTTLSNLLATAIENVKIRLYLERRVDEMSVLFEVSQSLTSTLRQEEVLDLIVNFSMEMTNALRCELRLLDTAGQLLEIKAARGLSKSFLSRTPIRVGEGILGQVISERKPISVVDVRKDPRTKHLQVVKREKLAGLLAVPIMQRQKPVGVISIYTSKPRDFTQAEIDLLTTFASQASIAIENARLYEKMKDQYLSMVMALAAAIETKDAYTHGHSKQVMEYAIKIARELELSDDEIETIKYAGLLHDIGKIGVRDVILSKEGPITAEERAELKNHPQYGAFIMEQVEFLKDIAPLTLYHHEKWDGIGYPLGLKGDKIPLGARIL
ncbi:MAG TPA: GAF domain-containing protein, partial [Candidatus Ozemobacteraceae bacterium]|nr:GAF domain-containing protein [Candidatus Ozemobacteraceae bacterium]